MQNHEVVTEEQRKFEAMLKYYQQRVTCCVCNRTKLRAAVDDLVSFLLETINVLRVKLELREDEIEKLQAEIDGFRSQPTFIPKPTDSDERPNFVDGSQPVYTATPAGGNVEG